MSIASEVKFLFKRLSQLDKEKEKMDRERVEIIRKLRSYGYRVE